MPANFEGTERYGKQLECHGCKRTVFVAEKSKHAMDNSGAWRPNFRSFESPKGWFLKPNDENDKGFYWVCPRCAIRSAFLTIREMEGENAASEYMQTYG